MENYQKNWLKLAIWALALSGILVIIVAGMRLESFREIFPYKDSFQTALVIHVILSVIVWMMCFYCLLSKSVKASNLSFQLCLAGTILISLAPFIHLDSKPSLNNYVPMLDVTSYIVGLAVFGLGILYHNICNLSANFRENKIEAITLDVILLISFITLIGSFIALKNNEGLFFAHDYYENLFWAFGHTLMFLFAQILIIVWFRIFDLKNSKLYLYILLINPLLVLYNPIIFFEHSIVDFAFKDFFSWQMKYLGGISSTLFVILAAYRFKFIFSSYKFAAVASVIIFGVGGIIGFNISGENTTIPAHYHGSIIGITTALMGYVYYLTSRDGIASKLQIVFYAFGQLLHIAGLAIAGNHGALRKMAEMGNRFAQDLVGVGVVLTLIGGVMFVIISLRGISQTRVTSTL